MKVIKKDGTIEGYKQDKIKNACKKSAQRCMKEFTEEELDLICKTVYQEIQSCIKNDCITVLQMHAAVEKTLTNLFPNVGECYRQYRNYKLDFVDMLDNVYTESQKIRYIGDKSNANTDSTMVSTQRSLIYGVLNKQLYKKFFLNKEERQAVKDGYIYIHDMKDRLDSVNCMLFDVGNVMKGGFEMGNIWYTEPKTLDVAFDVMSDIAMSAASQEYGGYTLPEVDKVLEPYCKKSYDLYKEEFYKIANSIEINPDDNLESHADEYATQKVQRDLEQGFQSWEMVFNSVGSSRGDYPFITITLGNLNTKFGKMIALAALKVREGGQGKAGFKKPVLFPKIVFLYDENLHGEGKPMEDVFEAGIRCSSKAMYPDWLSLTGNGYVAEMYKKYGRIVSPINKLVAQLSD